jgi:hypothetical protein
VICKLSISIADLEQKKRKERQQEGREDAVRACRCLSSVPTRFVADLQSNVPQPALLVSTVTCVARSLVLASIQEDR